MAQQGGGIVTPEAVRLEFHEADVGTRGLAVVLDWLLQAAVLVALNVALAMIDPQGVPGWAGLTILVVLNFLVVFGYPVGMETLWRGRTLGKAAFGLRVVTLEGAPVGFRHAALRAALGLVDFVLTTGVAAVLTSLLSKRHQRLGDMVAGTVVLRERTGLAAPTAARFTLPPGTQGYAATVDAAGATPRDYEAVRAFLLRADGLPEETRRSLARQLAMTVASRIRHRLPPEMGHETFLRVFAARYQARAGAGAPTGGAPTGGAPTGGAPTGGAPRGGAPVLPEPPPVPTGPLAEPRRDEAPGPQRSGGFTSPE